ncbi:hypothetical protein KAW18_01830 [candidate division WOR-3 bacterium]|nr:hypothetical protein [candidate division WOR-3 bacterium]
MKIKNWKRNRKSENRLAVRVYINTITGANINISKVRDEITKRYLYFVEMYDKNSKRLDELDPCYYLYDAENRAEKLMKKHSGK